MCYKDSVVSPCHLNQLDDSKTGFKWMSSDALRSKLNQVKLLYPL